MDDKRAFLRHTLATIAYRGGKAVRNAPASFASYATGEAPKTPVQILAHIGDLFDWALSIAKGKQAWNNATIRRTRGCLSKSAGLSLAIACHVMSAREAFGPNLRRFRLQRGITLEQLSAATNVSTALWTGLEQNDLTRWPTGLYAREYVR